MYKRAQAPCAYEKAPLRRDCCGVGTNGLKTSSNKPLLFYSVETLQAPPPEKQNGTEVRLCKTMCEAPHLPNIVISALTAKTRVLEECWD